MTNEFLTAEQKAELEARNAALRAARDPIGQTESRLLDALRVLKPNPYVLANGLLKKTTGRGALEHVLDNGLGSMARRTVARKGMRNVVRSAASTAWRGMGRLFKHR